MGSGFTRGKRGVFKGSYRRNNISFFGAAKRYVAGIGGTVRVDATGILITGDNGRSQSTAYGFSDYPTHGNVALDSVGGIPDGLFDFDIKTNPSIYGSGWQANTKMIIRNQATILLEDITIGVGVIGNAIDGNYTYDPKPFNIQYDGQPRVWGQ